MNVAAGFGRNDTALLQGILLRPDHFQVERSIVTVLVQHPDIADQVDVPAAIRLILRLPWSFLPSLAVTNVHMFHPGNHRLYTVRGSLEYELCYLSKLFRPPKLAKPQAQFAHRLWPCAQQRLLVTFRP